MNDLGSDNLRSWTDHNVCIDAICRGDADELNDLEIILDSFPYGLDENGTLWFANAVQIGHPDTIAWMIGKRGVDVNQRDIGYTMLQLCLEREYPTKGDKHEVLKLLIAAGAEVNTHGIHDWTALHMATVRNDRVAIKILLAAGADSSVRTRIDNYATPEEEARHLRCPEGADYLRDAILQQR